MKIVVIFPYREEYLAFEIIKSLLKFDAEIFCSKNIKNIKFILESNSHNHNIGTAVLDNCKICNDMEIIKKARSADYIFALGSRYRFQDADSCGGDFYLFDEINKSERTVFIDGSEWNASGWSSQFQKTCLNNKKLKYKFKHLNFYKGSDWINKKMRKKAKWYFKRETYLEDLRDNNIFPLPYSHRIEDIQETKNKKKK